ncbi:MAG: signal peptidase II [Actinomycetota bacterium]
MPQHEVFQHVHRRAVWILLSATTAWCAIDQVTKILAVDFLNLGQSIGLVGNFLEFRLVRNPGAAFSLATGMTWVLTLVAIAVVVVIARVARDITNVSWAMALGALLGGTLGNLIDRLVRTPGVGRGHVIDFIAYGEFFVGNVADIAIVLGAGLILILTFRGVRVSTSRA